VRPNASRMSPCARSLWAARGARVLCEPGRIPGGWKAICHGISHWASRRLFPDAKPHDARTAFIERQLAEHVGASGWLDGNAEQPGQALPGHAGRHRAVGAEIPPGTMNGSKLAA